MAELRRALFGYSRASVGAVIADRELMLQRASRDARSGEDRAERLATEVMETQARLARAAAQLATLRSQLENVTTMLAATQDMVADRDAQLRDAAEATEALAAEHRASLKGELDRVAELEELLADYRAELQARPMPASPTAVATHPREPDGTASTAEELAAVLLVAEQAVVRIIESTKERADEELRTVDEDRDRVTHEVDSMIAWRDRAAPIIASMQTTMDEVASRVADVAGRVGYALEPLTSGVLRLTTELASLDTVPRPIPPQGAGSREGGSGEGARVIELRDDQFTGREAARDT
jgi:chromosome segregation ATPase